MSKLTIRFLLIATMAFMGIMLIIGGAMGYFGVFTGNGIIQAMYKEKLPSALAIDRAQINLLMARDELNRALARSDQDGVTQAIDKSQDFAKRADEAWKTFQVLPKNADEQKLAAATDAARAAFIDRAYAPMLSAIKAGNKDEATRVDAETANKLFGDFAQHIDQLSAYQLKAAQQQYQSTQSAFVLFSLLDLFGVAGCLVAVSISAFILLRRISRPLKTLLSQFSLIGDGDLTQRNSSTSVDEMGQLLNGLENMRQSLMQTVSMVRQASASIDVSSGELAAGNSDLSNRTESQAGSLEQTASSMEQFTSAVKQNADSASEANTLAMAASEVASKGGQAVGEVVQTMASIKESSGKIVDIIGVIDNIAFQTNILALNAAVEAARAGEQGRSFAVVATEVRHLAQRSAEAAKQIKTLIGDSVEKVDAGAKLADHAGQTMDEIVVSIKNVSNIMSEITTASFEQSKGISEVNRAIAKMDEVTQQNAALVEQAAASSASMQEQVDKLKHAVHVFKIGDGDDVDAAGVSPVKFGNGAGTRPAVVSIAAAKSLRSEHASGTSLKSLGFTNSRAKS